MAEEATSDGRPRGAGGGLTAMGGDLLKTSAALVISGGVIAAVVVFLGRLWTDAYYRYFGLPTADLSPTFDEYAFQRRRLLILLALALATARATVLATQPWKWSLARDRRRSLQP